MFASWKPASSKDGSGVFLSKRPHTFDPATAKTAKPVACTQCRAQKVRCIGERGDVGCQRCQTMGRKCIYPPPSSTARSVSTNAWRRGSENAPGSVPPVRRASSEQVPLPYAARAGDSRTSVALASTYDTPNEWVDERPQRDNCTSGTGFFEFILDDSFTPSSEDVLSRNYNGQNEQFVLDETQITQDESLSLSPRHPVAFSGASTSATNWPSSAQWELPEPFEHDPYTATKSGSQTPSHASSDNTRSSGPECQCLHRVVILMDELEVLCEPSDAPPSADVILAAHRKTLRQANGMLDCMSCTARVENMTILTFLADRLTRLCRRAASILAPESAAGAPPTPEHHPSGGGSPVVLVGAYQLESETEFSAVVRTLLHLELNRLLTLVKKLQGVGKRLSSETMGRRLDECTKTVCKLLDGMGL